MSYAVSLRQEVRPVSPFRLSGGAARDGLLRRRAGTLQRLLHRDDEPVLVAVSQIRLDRVLLVAWAPTLAAAGHGLARMRFALGLDDDLSEFYRRFSRDPLIGDSVRRAPWLRVPRHPEPFEALAWAICEQLIDYERAAAIERRVLARLGRRCPISGLRDLPTAAALAAAAPALLESFDLAAGRALALVRAAREVASGRVDLCSGDHETGWRRLCAIPGIGAWTVQTVALHGQGRYDQLPAGDLKFLKLVGRLLARGDPRARASEREVRALFSPYAEWAGLAGAHALASPGRRGIR